jgi:hypothetical protein
MTGLRLTTRFFAASTPSGLLFRAFTGTMVSIPSIMTFRVVRRLRGFLGLGPSSLGGLPRRGFNTKAI